MANVPTSIGRYPIIKSIGHGGMGSLYLAWDEKLDRQIVIKVLREDDDQLRERFAREAKSAARLRHPNIVTIFELGEHDGQPYIAMEYIQGQTLGEIIRARTQLPLGRKIELMAQLCDGLSFAHKAGIVHRDVKPANIMLDAEGALKILDFGIARLAESASMTQAGMMIGTLNYMSPEQVVGQAVDQRSDVFAVGLVFYEFLTYKQAFPGSIATGVLAKLLHGEPEPLTVVCPGLDEQVVRIVNRAMEKDVANRYQELSSMRKEILALRSRFDETTASSPGLAPPAAPPTPRPPSVTPSPTGRRASERDELDKRRAHQIQYYLDLAERAMSEERFNSAIGACEESLLLDPDNARALELVDRARATLEGRQAQQLLADAGRDLQRGALTSARQLVEQAAALRSSPQQAELRKEIDRAIDERESSRRRADAIRDKVQRAESAFEAGAFTDAVRVADEVLALDSAHTGARSIRNRASAEAARLAQEAADRRAQDAIQEARLQFSKGDHAGAIGRLQSFAPSHESVSRTLAELTAEFAAITEQRRREAAARAREQRIASAMELAREELRDRRFAPALNRLTSLQQAEGASAEVSTLIREITAAEAAHTAAEAARRAEDERAAREAARRAAEERAAKEEAEKAAAAAREAARRAEEERAAREAARRAEEERVAREAARRAEAERAARDARLAEERAILQAAKAAELVEDPVDATIVRRPDATIASPSDATIVMPRAEPGHEPILRVDEPAPTVVLNVPPREPSAAPPGASAGRGRLVGLIAAGIIAVSVGAYFWSTRDTEQKVEDQTKVETTAVTTAATTTALVPVDQTFAEAMRTALASLNGKRYDAAVQQLDGLKAMNAAEFARQGLRAQRDRAALGRAGEIAEEGRRLLADSKLTQAKAQFQESQRFAATPAAKSGLDEIDRRQAAFAQHWQAATAQRGRDNAEALTNFLGAKAQDPEQFTTRGGDRIVEQLRGQVSKAEADKAAADALANENTKREAARRTSQNLLTQGKELAAQRKYDEAEAKYQQALTADQSNADAQNALSRSQDYGRRKAEGLASRASNAQSALEALNAARRIDEARFLDDGLDKIVAELNKPAPAPTVDELSKIVEQLQQLGRVMSTTGSSRNGNIAAVKQIWPDASAEAVFGRNDGQTITFSDVKPVSISGNIATVTCTLHRQTNSRGTTDNTSTAFRVQLQKTDGVWKVQTLRSGG